MDSFPNDVLYRLFRENMADTTVKVEQIKFIVWLSQVMFLPLIWVVSSDRGFKKYHQIINHVFHWFSCFSHENTKHCICIYIYIFSFFLRSPTKLLWKCFVCFGTPLWPFIFFLYLKKVMLIFMSRVMRSSPMNNKLSIMKTDTPLRKLKCRIICHRRDGCHQSWWGGEKKKKIYPKNIENP